MNDSIVHSAQTWTAAAVPQAARTNCLPRLFGSNCVRVESAIINMLGRLCEDYSGGYWQFYTLQNGGFYMAPDSDQPFRLQWDGNGYEGSVSADAAGVIACLMAFSNLSFLIDDARIATAYQLLRDCVSSHPEARAIFSATD